jgi:hypothetical protein
VGFVSGQIFFTIKSDKGFVMLKLTFEELFTYENIYKAHIKARCAKREKAPIVRFEISMLMGTRKIYEDIWGDMLYKQGYPLFSIKMKKAHWRWISLLEIKIL